MSYIDVSKIECRYFQKEITGAYVLEIAVTDSTNINWYYFSNWKEFSSQNWQAFIDGNIDTVEEEYMTIR